MAVDSSEIDAALIARLLGDTALMAICTDGVWWGLAKEGATRYVSVSLADAVDEPMYGGRAYESALYLVKAVALNSSGADVKTAAARIDVLLEDQPLTATGYTWMTTHRERRFRPDPDVDAVDKSIRWQERGGYYRVDFSVN